MALSFLVNSTSGKLALGLPIAAAAVFAGVSYFTPIEKASAQSGDVFQVWAICNTQPCTIGVAVPGWRHPSGWRSISGGFRGGARAWRHACGLHFNNSNYFSPDISNGRVNCAEMRRQASILDRGSRGGTTTGGRNRGTGRAVNRNVRSCPGTARNFRKKRATIRCRCTGQQTVAGNVWGSGPYTDDSDVCRAARHAGVIGSGGGTLTFRMVGGRNSYAASTRNGVRTIQYKSWHDSFTVTR